jgi:DNA-binding NarL/FixJ family response regulator
VLLAISKMEQRYEAVLGVVRDGRTVQEVADAFGVTRRSVHNRRQLLVTKVRVLELLIAWR